MSGHKPSISPIPTSKDYPSDSHLDSIDLEGGATPKSVDAEKRKPKMLRGLLRQGKGIKKTAKRLTFKKSSPPDLPVRKRRDILSRKNYIISLNEDEVFKRTTDHKEYIFGATILRGLAKFDDSTSYGITEQKEADLIRNEIKHIIALATQESPITFNSQGVLYIADLKGFESVSNLADQILCNLAVITHDNSRHVVENCPAAFLDAMQQFKRSRRQLIGRYRQKKSHVEGRQPKLLENPDQNKIAYFALVDYVLGVLAWWIVRTADSKFWKTQLLSILAQWAVKLKVVSLDPSHCAERSLADGEEMMRQLVANHDSKETVILRIRLGSDESERKAIDALDAEVDLSSIYYQEKMLLRQSLTAIVKWMLCSLLASERTGNNADSFEVCTLVYKTGFYGTPTVLSGDRDSDISASSDLRHISHLYAAFELLFRNTEALSNAQLRPTENLDSSPKVCVKWRHSKVNDQKEPKVREYRTSMIDEVISLLVPLSLSSPIPAAHVDDLIWIISQTADEEDPILQFMSPLKDFVAEYTISTSEWLNKQHRSVRFHDPDVRPLSASPLKQGIRAGTELARVLRSNSDEAPTAAENRASKMLDEYEANSKIMETWTFAQRSIIVNCRIYTISMLAFAIMIVGGSLAAPFTLGNKITGVDPFQITTFAWLLAGFILIGARSRYVNEWPWHDFLRGQVVCRSIKDVRDVTGINAQMILMYLLHNERKTILTTKGPYNGMFGRVSREGGGFSIDEPVQLSTMLASGFVVLKVQNEKGEHLICIDVRKGANWETAFKNESTKVLACMDTGKEDLSFEDSDGDQNDDTQQERLKDKRTHTGNEGLKADKVLKLEEVEFRWNRMLGLYVKDSLFG